MRVYTSKLTPVSVVAYLFHDWTQPVIVLLSVQYTSTDS